mmetsp:Transcript_9881/g.14567  ORF Transcript_9881/g.14567 Transcript_9881/m.14567 type:complete len:190 (+) Transcript_9881:63-632(+)
MSVLFSGGGYRKTVNQPRKWSIKEDQRLRKRILSIYNQPREDFNTLLEYNNYLEKIETIIYKKVCNIDVVNVDKEIAAYKKKTAHIGGVSKRSRMINSELKEKEDRKKRVKLSSTTHIPTNNFYQVVVSDPENVPSLYNTLSFDQKRNLQTQAGGMVSYFQRIQSIKLSFFPTTCISPIQAALKNNLCT